MDQLRRKVSNLSGDSGRVAQERDQALEDLKNVETAFSDLHNKYERAKGTLENLKKNEDLLLRRDEIMTQKLKEREQQVNALKSEVHTKLQEMFRDYESKRMEAEQENLRLKALVRKTEMKINSLERDLEQRTSENQELHKLCDDLISNRKLQGGGESFSRK